MTDQRFFRVERLFTRFNNLTPIGEFQLSVLMVVKKKNSASDVQNLINELSRYLGRDVSQPQIFMALKKLGSLGLITSEIERTETAGRRGRPRRLYSITAPGLRLLEAHETFSNSVRHLGEIHAARASEATTA